MASVPESLVDHLVTLYPEAFKVATQTPFLEKAGKAILSKEALQEWLAQDRLYAQAYLRFASLLLANIPLPPPCPQITLMNGSLTLSLNQ
jgi:thiaminase